MKLAHRTDFLFIGVAVLSAAFIAAGWLPALFLVSVPLLIAACLHGMYEQKVDEIEQFQKRSSVTTTPHTPATEAVLER